MAWLEDQREPASTNTDNIWLTFPKLQNTNDKAEIRMRILDAEPAGVWQHWLDGRPYNCCRPDHDCAVCQTRAAAKNTNPDTYRNDYPMRYRYFFNVLVEENGAWVVRVFGFGQGLGKDLRSYSEKYGPLTDYDITVRKTQTGRLPMNVEYSIFFEGRSLLNPEQESASRTRHDLSQFTKAATVDALRSVAQGQAPGATEDEGTRLLGEIKRSIPEDVDLSHLDIDANTPRERLEATLRALRGE